MRTNHIFWLLILIVSTIFGSCQQKNGNPEDNRPNILFAISDDQSYPHAGAYGCSWVKTPAFDRIAQEGILFNQAFTPNAKCSPSRACILTGRNSWQLEEATNHVPFFPEKFKTFPEVLLEHGYFVGRTGKGWAPGVAEKDGKPRDLIGKNYTEQTLVPPAKHISNNNYAENFRSFLEEKEDKQPFFFWYGATEPHRRYEFQSGINKGKKKLSDITEVPAFWPDNDTVRTDMLDYAFEIEHFDKHLSEMLKLLEEEGLLENTIVVVTSDNGMPFPRIKGQIYEYDNHLPLAIRWGKGINSPGRTIDDYVNFIDFAPTFLEMAGISTVKSGMQSITGKSLYEFFNTSKSGIVSENRNFVLIGKERHDVGRPKDEGYPVRGIIQGNYAYTINFKPDRWPAGNPETGYLNTDGSPTKTYILNERRRERKSYFWDLNFGKRAEEELYDISQDPFCLNNLASENNLAARKSELKTLLFAELKKQEDPRILGKGAIFDNYQYANPSTAGFYERYNSGEEMKAGWVNPGDFEKE
ncbi:MAG: sulfatase [Bacteroidetes bacterium]|nr:sulfatase [Bacteroidota bacterium]